MTPLDTLFSTLALLAGLAYTVRIGRGLFRGILADPRRCVPDWLESWMPLKGRWLRCLVAAPALLFVLGLVWLSITGLLILSVLLVHGLWGVLTGGR
jgi:hypothetical protein